MKIPRNKSVIIFDGVCNLCNSSVRFVLKRDKKQSFVFATLQSDVARDILLQYPKEITKKDSIVLIRNNKIYTESTAALLIVKEFGGSWKAFQILWIIPKFLRDSIYRFVARHRYQWFGKRDTCFIANESDTNRFI